MKVSMKTLLIVSVIIILAPIFIGIGVSADILNDWTNSNDWIGFWGSYAGAVVGGIITLVVLWNTLEDNKRARNREEKINYYNNLIEIMAVFFSDMGNYLTEITAYLNDVNEQTYRSCINAGNQLAKSSMIFDTQLYIKKDINNIAQIMEDIKSLEDEVDTFIGDVKQIMKNDGRDRKQIDDLFDKTQVALKKMNDYIKVVPELIKEELD